MRCGSTVRSERSMAGFGATERGPSAGKNEADAAEFTCAARENPSSRRHTRPGAKVRLGYEDLNDHQQLRQDPLLHVLAGKPEMDEPLAGKSTLNRLELSDGTPNRYKKVTYWKDCVLPGQHQATDADGNFPRHNLHQDAR